MNYPIELEPETLRVLEVEALEEGTTVHGLITNMINGRIEQRAFDHRVKSLIHDDVLSAPRIRRDLNSRLARAGLPSAH